MTAEKNDFIWVDLSSYNPAESAKFYQEMFWWKYFENSQYFIAFSWEKQVSWLYETPDFFKKINMPHFWMWYIQVENVLETVKKARENWWIIEIEKDEFYWWNIALIRDSLWAWFTVYDGQNLSIQKDLKNCYISSELHISDIDKVKGFYEKVFNRKIVSSWKNIYDVLSFDWKKISQIMEINSFYKWKYEYWVVIFWVENLEESIEKALSLWWKIISMEDSRVLFSDNSDEAFFYIKQI